MPDVSILFYFCIKSQIPCINICGFFNVEMDEVSLMQLYGQIFRELTFIQKPPVRNKMGQCEFFGAEVSAD